MVHLAHHNISPLLDKQLVLELEVKKASLEIIDRFPGGFRLIQTGPFDEDQPSAATQLCLESALRLQQQTTVMNWRQCRQDRWWRSTPQLEDADVENIMDPGTIRQLKMIGHGTNPLQDLVRPSKMWAQLRTLARHQGLCRAVEQPE